MNNEKAGIVLGALLHDIGKFMQRAEIEKEYPEIKDNYNTFCPTPYSYLHAAHSAFFIERFLNNFLIPDEQRESLFNACRHHCDPGQQDLFKTADRLSAGMEREHTPSPPKGYKKTKLHSIFDNVELAYKISGGADNFRPLWNYNLNRLDKGGELFPQKIATQADDNAGDLTGNYHQLWVQFANELRRLQGLNIIRFQHLFNELFYLIQKYTWCIPSATNALPDISLFDHLKTTSAIAGCLYDYEKEGRADQNEFLLVSGDLSGIQSFIFRITASQGVGGVSKRLRGRSFYIMMLNEIFTRYILHNLELTVANINFCGGGNFEILLPNTTKTTAFLTGFETDVNQWLLKRFSGQITLVAEWLSLSQADVQNRFGECKVQLYDKIALRKKRKFQAHLDPDCLFLKDNASIIDICKACNLSLAPKEDEICSDCRQHKKLGECLPVTQALGFVCGGDTMNVTKGLLETIQFGSFGKIFLLANPDSKAFYDNQAYTELLSITHNTNDTGGFYHLSNILPTSLKDMHLETERDAAQFEESGFVRKNTTLSFTTLADMAEGDKRIGVLKMDVDNLGMVLSVGLKHFTHAEEQTSRLYSISRISTLSRHLSYFLTLIVGNACNEITREWQKNSDWGSRVSQAEQVISNNDVANVFYIVFSGGDDLFIIGPWDRVIDLAVMLRKRFKDFTCHNPNLTISAGLFICKPKYPIQLAAEKAEEALKQSKTKGRNRITVFGETTVWDYEDKQFSRVFDNDLQEDYIAFEKDEIRAENIFKVNVEQAVKENGVPFARLRALYANLYAIRDNIPRGFIHRLLDAKQKFYPVAYNRIKEREEESHNTMVFPYLFYYMHRTLDRETRRTVQQELISPPEGLALLRQIKIPAMIYLMKTRKQ